MTYLIKTGETPLTVVVVDCGVWTVILTVAGGKNLDWDWKIMQMRDDWRARAVTVVDCWLRASCKRRLIRDVNLRFSIWDFKRRLIREGVNKVDQLIAFDLFHPIGGWHVATTVKFYLLWANSLNRVWNRDFMRFHPILTIFTISDAILLISEFYERFST